jgi:putative peptidoglycan lipid II flippase
MRLVRFLRGVLSGENSLRSGTFFLVLGYALSNLSGLVRSHFLYKEIPTNLLDSYIAAFRWPDAILWILIGGTLVSAFVPVFTGYLTRKKTKEAWKVASNMLTTIVVGLFFVLGLLYLLLPILVPLVVPDFPEDKQMLTLQVSRIVLISNFIFGIAYLFSGVLHSFRRFFAFSIAPVFYNVGIIAGTVLFADRLSVFAPAWGAVAGSLLFLLVQIIPSFQLGFRIKIAVQILDRGVREILRLMTPRVLSEAVKQIGPFVFTALASATVGAVAIYDAANNIQTMPSVVFGSSVAIASLPFLSRQVSLKKWAAFRRLIFSMLRWTLYFLIPAAVGLILLRAQTVRLIYGYGYFSWEDTIRAASTLGFFALSIPAAGLIPILARAFFAMKNTRTPFQIGAVSTLIAVFFGMILRLFAGTAPGLALAFSIGTVVNAVWLYFALENHLIGPDQRAFVRFLFKVVVSSLVMAGAVQGTKIIVGNLVNIDRVLGLLVQTLGAVAVGFAVFYIVSRILRLPEAQRMSLAPVLSRFRSK